MSSTYSQSLDLELIGTGDQAGTWGSTTNNNLTAIDQAIGGYQTYSCSGGTDVLSIPGVARNMYLELDGTGGGNVVVPTNPKLYFVFNNTSAAITVKVSGGTGVSVPSGAKMSLVCNGTDVSVAENLITTATNVANISGGALNEIPYQTAAGATSFITAPSVASTFLQWNGSAFAWASAGGGGTAQSLTVNNSGSGVSSPASFNGSSAVTISYNTIGAAAFNGTNATGTSWNISITGNAATATSVTKLATSNWTVQEIGGKLYFQYGGSNKASLDSSGNLIVTGNVTAFGTP